VAARCREDVEGEETAWEAAVREGNLEDGGIDAIVLWRGAKGHERIARESHISRAVGGAHTSEVSREAKTIEGAKNQYGRQLRR
jgi:hypothetical protein